MPYFALLLCTIFVIFLLRLDSKQAQGITLAVWIPTIWMLVVSSKPVGTWLAGGDGGDANMVAGSPMDRTFFLIILACGLIILIPRKINWSSILKENIWLIVLIHYMMLSLFWSEMSFVSLKRWIREIVAVVMFLLVISEPNPGQALQAIFRRTIYILIPYSLVLINYFSYLGRIYTPWSGEVMWIGATTHKNSLARLCAFTIFFSIWTFVRRRRGRYKTIVWYQTYFEIFILVLALYLFGGPNHSLNYSATSLVCLIFGLTSFLGFLLMKKWGKLPDATILTVTAVVIMIYGIATPFLGGLYIVDPSSILGRNETLTNRTDVWLTLIPLALKNFLFGHGFGGFWTDEMRNISSSHAHNGYLDVILDLGFIGLFIIAIAIISYLKKAQKILALDFDWGVFFVCYVSMLLIYNIAESSLTSLASHMSATLFFLAVFFTSYLEKLTKYSKFHTIGRDNERQSYG